MKWLALIVAASAFLLALGGGLALFVWVGFGMPNFPPMACLGAGLGLGLAAGIAATIFAGRLPPAGRKPPGGACGECD